MLQVLEPATQQIGSVLWLDDDVEYFVAQKKRLQDRGIRVYEADSTAKAYDIMASADIDLCIVDLKISPQQGGVEFIELIHEKYQDLVFLVYSNFAHLPSHTQKLQALQRKLQGRLWNLPKGRVPSANTDEFEAAFLDPIESLVKKRKPSPDLVVTFQPARHRKSTRFDIPLSEYLSYPIEERIKFLTEFRSRHGTAIEKLFREGYVWILFLGDDDVPFKKEKDRRNVLGDAAIARIAQTTKKIPYHFFADSIADDFDHSSACSSTTEAKGYPTLVIEYGEHTFETHFDTGLYQTHFDRDFCELIGLTTILLFPGLGSMQAKSTSGKAPEKRSYGLSYFHVDASIQRKSNGEAFPVALTGISTVNWKNSNFYRECFSDCKYHQLREFPEGRNVPRRNTAMCVFRDGLLGRTLMEDNPNLVITLQHGKADVSVEERE